MVARYAVAACLLVALSAAAGVAALESGNLAYLSPVVELPGLAKDGARCLCPQCCIDTVNRWSEHAYFRIGQMSGTVACCVMRICASGAEPVSALAHSRSLLSGHGHKHQDPAKSAWESRTKRNRDTVFAQVSRTGAVLGLRHPCRMEEQEVQLRGADVPPFCPCGMCSYCKASVTILVSQPRDVPRHNNLVSQWTARTPNSAVFRPCLSRIRPSRHN